MTTMNISLPDDMKAFIEDQVRAKGYTSVSEYIRDLIRRQRTDIEELRAKIVEGIDSGVSTQPHGEWLAQLRDRIESNNPTPIGWFDEEFFNQMLKKIAEKK